MIDNYSFWNNFDWRATAAFVIALFLGSFVFIVALAWNDLVIREFDLRNPDNESNRDLFIYTISVTVAFLLLSILASIFLPTVLNGYREKS